MVNLKRPNSELDCGCKNNPRENNELTEKYVKTSPKFYSLLKPMNTYYGTT